MRLFDKAMFGSTKHIFLNLDRKPIRIRFLIGLLLLILVFPVRVFSANEGGRNMVLKDTDEIIKILDDVTSRGDLKMAVGLIANSEGVLFEHASGFRDDDNELPMQTDSIFAIASMTKLITTIAALQLVDSGQVGLDQEVDEYLSEIRDIQILRGFESDDKPIIEKATRSPTVRELITHTSGYVYSIWNETAFIAQTKGITSPLGGGRESIDAPLYFEPGSKWEYGIGIDWLGELVEKVSGKRLMDYFSAHIFLPLGMEDTFYEYPEGKMDRSIMMSARIKNKLIRSELYQPIPAEQGSLSFYGGGGGLYSTVFDYSRVMRALLNGGVLDDQRILSEGLVEQMFQNQIGELNVSKGEAQIKALSNDFDMGFGSQAKWGLGFLVSPDGTENGRSAGSVSWAGLFNSYFWIDREKDICAVFATQVLPFYDEKAIETLKLYERAVYDLVD